MPFHASALSTQAKQAVSSNRLGRLKVELIVAFYQRQEVVVAHRNVALSVLRSVVRAKEG